MPDSLATNPVLEDLAQRVGDWVGHDLHPVAQTAASQPGKKYHVLLSERDLRLIRDVLGYYLGRGIPRITGKGIDC